MRPVFCVLQATAKRKERKKKCALRSAVIATDQKQQEKILKKKLSLDNKLRWAAGAWSDVNYVVNWTTLDYCLMMLYYNGPCKQTHTAHSLTHSLTELTKEESTLTFSTCQRNVLSQQQSPQLP